MCCFGTDPSMCWYPYSFEGCWRLEGFWGVGMGLRGGLVASRRVAWKMLLLLLFWEMDGTWT